MRRRGKSTVRVVLCALATLGCTVAGGPTVPESLSGELYTLTNLHPDEARQLLYSVNYQQAGLIPRCSRVNVRSLDDEAMSFVVLETGRPYRYVFHKSMMRAPADHLSMYFGKTCPQLDPSKFTEDELEAIRAGEVREGMSKGAVVYAIGYPPAHATPSLDANAWMYWKNRFDRFRVKFDDGRVTAIED